MKTILSFFLCCSVVSVYPQWVVVDTVQAQYFQIYFYNNQVGFISSYNFYKKTLDGGQTWATIADNGNNKRYDICFLNSDTGFSRLGITHNGGQTWSGLNNFTVPFCFTENNQYGFSAAYMPFGNPAPTFKSSNKGETWVQRGQTIPDPNGFNTGVISINFADSLHGMIGAGEGSIYKTKNGGTSWTLIQPLGNGYDMNGVFMVDSLTAFVYAYNNNAPPFGSAYDKILRTTDGGANWQSTDVELSGKMGYTKLQFFGNLKGYYANGHYFFSTHDGGMTWTPDLSVYGVNDFSFVNEHTVYLLTWDSILTNGAVMKRDINDDIKQIANLPGSFDVVPNPFNNEFTISLSEQQDERTIQVFDMTGRKIYQVSPTSDKFSLQTDSWENGIYFLKIGNTIRKIVKQ